MNHSTLFSVGKMCLVLKVNRGGFFSWVKSVSSSRNIKNQLLEAEILHAFQNSEKHTEVHGSYRNDFVTNKFI